MALFPRSCVRFLFIMVHGRCNRDGVRSVTWDGPVPGRRGAAVPGDALGGPSVTVPRSVDGHAPRGWRDS